MEVSSKHPINLAYFYPHSNSCPERIERAKEHGETLHSFRDLFLEEETLFEGHIHKNFTLPDGTKDWDDADVEIMSQHLQLASKLGTGLFWDLFVGCVNGKPITELQKPYEVMLRLNQDVPFSVMFSYNRARVVTPVPEGFKEHDRTFDLTKETARWMVDYLSKDTIDHLQFVHIDGRPVIAFGAFSLSFDNCDNEIHEVVSEFKRYAKEKWQKEPYLVAVICDEKGAIKAAQSGLFDAATGYCYLPSFDPSADPIQDYTVRVEETFKEWNAICEHSLPFFAPFSLGWDASLRARYSSPLDSLGGQYPHAPIIVGATNAALERTAARVTDFNDAHFAPIRPIFSFNEVEEGAALLPIESASGQLEDGHIVATFDGLNYKKNLV